MLNRWIAGDDLGVVEGSSVPGFASTRFSSYNTPMPGPSTGQVSDPSDLSYGMFT